MQKKLKLESDNKLYSKTIYKNIFLFNFQQLHKVLWSLKIEKNEKATFFSYSWFLQMKLSIENWTRLVWFSLNCLLPREESSLKLIYFAVSVQKHQPRFECRPIRKQYFENATHAVAWQNDDL